MKTLLIGINAKYIHTNLAIRYLYTFTYPQFDVDFCEFTIKDDTDRIVNAILSQNPQLVGISCYIWNIEKVVDIVYKLKERQPDVKILLGGPEVSYDAEYFLSSYPIDYIISGEGEYPFKQLLEALVNQKPLKNVPQLYYKTSSNIVHNKMDFCGC